MSRAYIRLDPAFDEHKEHYPDGAYAALIAVFCAAEHQAKRGRFRSSDYLARMLGKRGKWVNYLIENKDLAILPDGRLYVIGWDEWQEGDWKVTERVQRIRAGRNDRHNAPTVTPTVTGTVTPSVTHPGSANGSPSDVSGAELSKAERSGADSRDGGTPPPPTPFRNRWRRQAS